MHQDLLAFTASFLRNHFAGYADRVQVEDIIIVFFIQCPFDPLRIQRCHLMPHGMSDAGSPDHMLTFKIKKYLHLILSFHRPVLPKPPHRCCFASSSSQMPNGTNTPWANALPAGSVSGSSAVNRMRICPSLSAP